MHRIVVEYESYGNTWDSVTRVFNDVTGGESCDVVLSDNGNDLPELYAEAQGAGDPQVLWEKVLGQALEEIVDTMMKAAVDIQNYEFVRQCQQMYEFLYGMVMKPCGDYRNGKKG